MTNTKRNKIISINELWRFYNRCPNFFCILGTDGYLKQVNPYVTEILGFSEEHILSIPHANLIHEEDRYFSEQQLVKVRKEKQGTQFQNRLVSETGNSVLITWTASYVPEEDDIYLIGQVI